MSLVFVDTSALLPLLDADDRDHDAVLAGVDRLAEENAPLITSSYCLVECGALTRSRLGMKAFAELGKIVERAVDVVWIDQDLHRRAWAKTALESRSGPSLVDWTAFLVMEAHGITRALAIDQHFSERGIETIP